MSCHVYFGRFVSSIVNLHLHCCLCSMQQQQCKRHVVDVHMRTPKTRNASENLITIVTKRYRANERGDLLHVSSNKSAAPVVLHWRVVMK